MSASRLPPRPYPGIRPFNKDEWRIFYGRNAIINSVIDRLSDRQIIFVHGRSGCGKSSLIKAGVLPRLEREHSRYGMHWQTAQMRPGGSPLWNMAVAFAQLLPGHNADEAPELEAIESVLKRLYRGREALTYLAEELKIGQEASACILVDQFEELFRYSDNVNLDEATLFADVLSGFAHNPPEGIHAIATMRSDFLGDCANFEGLAELINESQFLLPKLTGNQLRDAITTPARLFGGEVSDDLATLLIQESHKHADALPLVEHCLMYLWQAAQREAPPEGHEGPWPVLTTDQFPGLNEALSNKADEVLKTLKGEVIGAGKATEFLFRAIIEVDADRRATRRPLRRSEILSITGRDEETIDRIVEGFADPETNFLLLSDENEDDPVIDMTHEALIRCWGQLTDESMEAGQVKGWIMREAADAQLWRDLIARSSNEKDVIPSRLLPERQEAYDRIAGPAWAERYGGHWKQVEALFSRSHDEARKERRRAILVNVGIPAAGIMIALLMFLNVQATRESNRILSEKIDFFMAAQNDVEAFRSTRSLLRAEVSSTPLPGLLDDIPGTALSRIDKEKVLALEFLPDPSDAEYFRSEMEDLGRVSEMEVEFRNIDSIVGVTPSKTLAHGSDEARRRSGTEVTSAVYSAASGKLAIGGWGGELTIVLPSDGENILSPRSDEVAMEYFTAEGMDIARSFWNPSGDRVLATSSSGILQIIDVNGGDEAIQPEPHSEVIAGAAWSHDGTSIYTGSYDDLIRQYDASTGNIIETWEPLRGQRDINDLAISPDGARLVAGVDTSEDRSLVFIDLLPGTEGLAGDGPDHRYATNFKTGSHTYAVDWSDDGQWIAAGYISGGFTVFNAKTGTALIDIPKFSEAAIWELKFDPSSKYLAIMADQGRVTLFDLDSKQQVAELSFPVDQSLARGLTWSEGGRIIFASTNTSVYAFDVGQNVLKTQTVELELPDLIRRVRQEVPRCFTAQERQNLNLPSEVPEWCAGKPPYLAQGLFLAALDEFDEGNWDEAQQTWTQARAKILYQPVSQGFPMESFDAAITKLAERSWQHLQRSFSFETDPSELSAAGEGVNEYTRQLLENATMMADSRKDEVLGYLADQLEREVSSSESIINLEQALLIVAEINNRTDNAFSPSRVASMIATQKLREGELRDAVWLLAESVDSSGDGPPTAEQVYDVLPRSSWTEREFARLPDDQYYFSLTVNPEGGTLIASSLGGNGPSGRGEGILWDLASHSISSKIDTQAYKFAFSPNGESIATPQSQGDVNVASIWTSDGARQVQQLVRDAENSVSGMGWAVDWSENGRWIATSHDQQITIWDAETRLPVHEIDAHSALVFDLEFSPDSELLASTAWDGTANIIAVASGEIVQSLEADGNLERASWSPSGETLALAGWSQFWIWDRQNDGFSQPFKTEEWDIEAHYGFSYSPDGAMIAFTSSNRLQVWDALTLERIFISGELGRDVYGMTWLPDTQTVITISQDGIMHRLEPIDYQSEVEQILGEDPVCFSGEDRASMQLAEVPPAWCASAP